MKKKYLILIVFFYLNRTNNEMDPPPPTSHPPTHTRLGNIQKFLLKISALVESWEAFDTQFVSYFEEMKHEGFVLFWEDT